MSSDSSTAATAGVAQEGPQVAVARADAVRLVVDARHDRAERREEQALRRAAAGEVPHARRDDPAGARDADHLADAGRGIRHEMHHELGERGVEGVVVERQMLGDTVADVGPGVPCDRRGDEALGRIDTRHLGLAESRGELLGERSRPASHVERSARGGKPGAVDEERGERPGVPAHEAVVRLRGDVERHGGSLRPAF